MGVYACAYMCVCVCECVRERDAREEQEGWRKGAMALQYVYVCATVNALEQNTSLYIVLCKSPLSPSLSHAAMHTQ